MELLDVGADGVVRLRMPADHDGCGSTAATLRLAVEGAIEAAAPEVTAIEFEEPAAAPGGGSVIPVSALFSRIAAAGPDGARVAS
nr:hypothetical protein GCM10020092_082410 [Actinoplanes digitatis]